MNYINMSTRSTVVHIVYTYTYFDYCIVCQHTCTLIHSYITAHYDCIVCQHTCIYSITAHYESASTHAYTVLLHIMSLPAHMHIQYYCTLWLLYSLPAHMHVHSYITAHYDYCIVCLYTSTHVRSYNTK